MTRLELDALARSDPSRGYADNAASAKTWVMKLERTPRALRRQPNPPRDPLGPEGDDSRFFSTRRAAASLTTCASV